MAPGASSKFGAPMFETEVFRKHMYCIEGSTCDIVRTFRRLPQWFGAPIVIRCPGNCASFPPSLQPWLFNTQIKTCHLNLYLGERTMSAKSWLNSNRSAQCATKHKKNCHISSKNTLYSMKNMACRVLTYQKHFARSGLEAHPRSGQSL